MTAPAVDPDPGTARSRTVLAWQRTALSVAAGTLLLVRLGYDELGPGVLVGLLGLPLAAWVLVHGTRARATAPGLAGALLALAVTALCLTELLVLVDPS